MKKAIAIAATSTILVIIIALAAKLAEPAVTKLFGG